MIDWAIEEVLFITAMCSFTVGFLTGFLITLHHFRKKIVN